MNSFMVLARTGRPLRVLVMAELGAPHATANLLFRTQRSLRPLFKVFGRFVKELQYEKERFQCVSKVEVI